MFGFKRIVAALTLLPSISSAAPQNLEWPFDQSKNVATITTKQVIHKRYPILTVVHYLEDHSWAFLCGTTNNSDDLMLVGMEQIVKLDPSLKSIADLPPGWSAYRKSTHSKWVRTKDE